MAQAMPSVQQAQANHVNPQTQIYSQTLSDIQQTTGIVGTGWQSTFDPQQRALRVMQLYATTDIDSNITYRCK